MRRVAIIGYDSYLAKGLETFLSGFEILNYTFLDWFNHLPEIKSADTVINFSISPIFSLQTMKEEDIIDVQIAKELKNCGAQFVFISSRKVYGISQELLIHREEDKLAGVDFYAKNKIYTEKCLQDILNDKLTILRVPNICGEPIFRFGYKTFMGWICENYIKTGRLVVNQNINSMKDFVSKEYLHFCIAEVIKQKLTGVYNCSSGFPTKVGDILAGYVGRENIIIKGDELPLEDQFVLDNSKLKQHVNIEFTPDILQKHIDMYRKQLCTYCAQSENQKEEKCNA